MNTTNRDLDRLGLEVPDEIVARLRDYLHRLLEANKQFNLTAVRDPDQAWGRHIVDSLTLLPGLIDLPDNAKLADVGCGGGLPGIPLAIALPHVDVTLVESTGKKARFCKQCADDMPLDNVVVVNDRAEHVGQNRDHRQRYDVVVCRALGPMRELLEYTLPLIKVGGALLAMKGPSVEKELPDIGDALDVLGGGEVEVIDAYPEDFDNQSVIVRVVKDRPTPKLYPRVPGAARQTPL